MQRWGQEHMCHLLSSGSRPAPTRRNRCPKESCAPRGDREGPRAARRVKGWEPHGEGVMQAGFGLPGDQDQVGEEGQMRTLGHWICRNGRKVWQGLNEGAWGPG